jgi:hypothetical protein
MIGNELVSGAACDVKHGGGIHLEVGPLTQEGEQIRIGLSATIALGIVPIGDVVIV